MIGSHILGASGSVFATPGGGGNFTPASGFTISSPSGVSNGSIVTVNASSGTPFGTKPYAAAPLLWAPFDTSGNPSSLGRITSFQSSTPLNSGTFTYQSTGGPVSGCMASQIATGASGVWNWALGIDINQWSGWAAADPFGGGNGYYLNDYGTWAYIYHRTLHTFGHLDESASLSYNGIAGYNVKNVRLWSTTPIATVNAAQATPEWYNPTSSQIFAVDGLTQPLPGDYPSGGGAGQGAVTTSAVVSAENIQNTWYAEEMLFTSNSNTSNADANFQWRVPAAPTQGPFTYGSMYSFPTTTYHTIGFQFLNAAVAQTLAGNQRGTVTRIYPMHYIIDGTSGSHTAAPAGAQVLYADVYADDSPCRIMATNSATWGSETDFQIQIPTAWAGSSVSFSTHQLPLNWYVYIVNSSNVATYVGQRTS